MRDDGGAGRKRRPAKGKLTERCRLYRSCGRPRRAGRGYLSPRASEKGGNFARSAVCRKGVGRGALQSTGKGKKRMQLNAPAPGTPMAAAGEIDVDTRARWKRLKEASNRCDRTPDGRQGDNSSAAGRRRVRESVRDEDREAVRSSQRASGEEVGEGPARGGPKTRNGIVPDKHDRT